MSQLAKNRKLMLYGALALMAALYFGDSLFGTLFSGPFEEREERIARLKRDIQTREEKLAAARRTAGQIETWENQALPSNVEVARSLYQAWLLEAVGRAGLSNPHVDSSDPANRKGLYQLLTFSVRGRGSLTSLTQLLYDFYRAPHLHQIRTINLTPVGNQGEMDLAITLEAISLPKAARQDELASGHSDRLLFENLDPYLAIAQRNIFGTGGGYDPAEHALLTAVLSADGELRAWFTLRETDELHKLAPGEKLRVGRIELELVRIHGSDVLLAARGEYWLLSIGESLAEAVAIPADLVLDGPLDAGDMAARP